MPLKKLFIFDLDDTLVDSYSFNQQMFIDTFYLYYPNISVLQESKLRELHFSSRGQSMIKQFNDGLDYLKLSAKPFDLLNTNERLHAEHISEVKLFQGAKAFLTLLNNSGNCVSLLSNRQTASLTKVIVANDIANVFDQVISCSDEGHEKPDPYCLLKLISHSGLSKEDCVYFGDSRTDVEFAAKAGIDWVVVDHYLHNGRFFEVITKLPTLFSTS